jgi:hypothetical protein
VTASDYLFASVIEPHGYFNEAGEVSRNARSIIESVSVIGSNAEGSIIEITGKNNLKWQIDVNNQQASDTAKHSLKFNDHEFNWTGNFMVDLSAGK